jgi:hypothetical protein
MNPIQTTARVADDLDVLTAKVLLSLPHPITTIPRLTVEEWREVALAFLLTITDEIRERPAYVGKILLRAASAPETPPPHSPA